MAEIKVDTVVRGGTLVTSSGTVRADIAIRDGKIAAIGPQELLPSARRYIDAGGKYVLPGVIDVHMHFKTFTPHMDTIRTAFISAAHGGTTTTLGLLRPADSPAPILETINHFVEEGSRDAVTDFSFHMHLAPDYPNVLEDIPKAVAAGITSFKMFMGYRWAGGRTDDEFIFKAMQIIGREGGLAMFHCEDGDIIFPLEDQLVAAREVGPRAFLKSRPNEAEEAAVKTIVGFVPLTSCPAYVVHLSARQALDVIKQAQLGAKRIWTETCPQYLLLTDDEVEREGPLAKVGPPLRLQPDVDAMWAGVSNSWISVIGSDHAAYTKQAKEKGFTNIFRGPFGCPGAETLLPLMHTEGVVKRGLPVSWLARVLAENPAKLFGLYPRKGAIQIGADADLVIFDPKKKVTISATNLHTNSDYTLYEGWEAQGWPEASLLRGEYLLKDGKLQQEPGYGKFLKRYAGEGAAKLAPGRMQTNP